MNGLSKASSIGDALRFLAELSAAARECAASGAWTDELSLRRRHRDDVRPAFELRAAERQRKAL